MRRNKPGWRHLYGDPAGGMGVNAYYSRKERSLRFSYFHPNNDENAPLVYTCRSFDIVAHETGHAILDAQLE